MKTFFPVPYPDELLYSTIARYHILSGNAQYCQTAEDLFGFRRAHSSVVMPLRLGYLGRMTDPLGLSVEKLISHTLAPYYTAFQTEDLCQEIIDMQVQNKSVSVSAKLGALGNPAIIPKHLRFCPKCYAEDQRQYGEGYWHRTHQTPGGLVCEKHGCQLLQTQIPYYDQKSNVYEAATPLRLFPAAYPSPLSPLGLQQAANIASDIRYLYDHYDQVRSAFAKHQYSFTNVFISLLQKKGLATKGGTLRLAEFKEKFYSFFAPDLMEQLGEPIDTSIEKPWFVTMCRHSKKTFHPLRYILISRFLCHGLPGLIQFAEETSPERLVFTKASYGCAAEDEKREQYRTKWLDVCGTLPGAGRNELRGAAGATYTWLLRHDKEWLMEHPKERRLRGGNKVFSDRTQQDLMLSAKTHAAAKALRSVKGKPVWITKTCLAKKIGLIPKLLPELPMTQKAFEEEVESLIEYRLRRIAWAESLLISQGKPTVRWQVLKLAAIRECDWDECWDAYIAMKNFAQEEYNADKVS